jgi:hypothetical protein
MQFMPAWHGLHAPKVERKKKQMVTMQVVVHRDQRVACKDAESEREDSGIEIPGSQPVKVMRWTQILQLFGQRVPMVLQAWLLLWVSSTSLQPYRSSHCTSSQGALQRQ